MFKEWYETHPIERIDFSAPLFPPAKDRAFWSDKTPSALIAEAEQYCGFTWPMALATDFMAYRTEGDRQKQEKKYFARRMALLSLFLGELAEYQGRFLPDIVNGLFAISEESFWGVSAHYKDKDEAYMLPDARNCYIDLFAAETASLLALVYQMLYEELEAYCPEILHRIEYEMERRILEPYLSHTDFWWMGYMSKKPNNWNPWILSNLLTVFLVMEKRRSVFPAALRKMFREIDRYYEPYPLDGGCDEGANYWGVAGATLFEFCEQLYTATGGVIDFFGDEKLRNTGKYIYRVYIGKGRFVNFADGTPEAAHSMGGLLYLFGQRIGDPRLAAMAKICMPVRRGGDPALVRDAKIKRGLYALIYQREIDALPEPSAGEDEVLTSIQNAFVRNGDWYYAAKGGHNAESHNHNDVGSFMVYRKDQPVLIDPGCGTYTAKTFSPRRYEIWTMHSSWHNLPDINGVAQANGAEFRANSFSFEEKKTAVGFAAAYPPEAGLCSALRTVEPKENGVCIRDAFTFSKNANRVEEHFITHLDVKLQDGQAMLGDQYILKCDAPAEILLDFRSFEGDQKLIQSWNCAGLTRICFRIDGAAAIKLQFDLEEIK